MIEVAFNEDKAIVKSQQRLTDQDPASALFVNFPFDKAGQSARRNLERLITEEQGTGGKLEAAE